MSLSWRLTTEVSWWSIMEDHSTASAVEDRSARAETAKERSSLLQLSIPQQGYPHRFRDAKMRVSMLPPERFNPAQAKASASETPNAENRTDHLASFTTG